MIKDRILEYQAYPALNQSYLKALAIDGVSSLEAPEQELFYEEKDHFIYGLAVDCLLTSNREEFEALYHVSRITKPSDTIMSVIQQVFKERRDLNEHEMPFTRENYGRSIYDALNAHGYAMNRMKDAWEGDTRIDDVLKKGTEYWEELKLSLGKQVLDNEQQTLIEAIYHSLVSSEVTSRYFLDPTKEMVSQLAVYFEYRGHQCKILVDWAIFDHGQKTIQPLDVKTSGEPTHLFPSSVRRFRYDFQGSFYTKGLSIAYPDYKILPFKFVVETTRKNKQGNPLVYTMTPALLHTGQWGIPELYVEVPPHKVKVQRFIPGFEQALDLHEWHVQNGFDTDKIIKELKGDIPLEFYSEILKQNFS